MKIPIGFLLWLVWWAIHQTPDDAGESHRGDGGSKVGQDGRDPRHPRKPFPRRPRPRGPHGEPTPAAPARTRVHLARTRAREH
ncbi:MAG TPA: hypothetical protein VGM91_14030 [Conexibacter sp.]